MPTARRAAQTLVKCVAAALCTCVAVVLCAVPGPAASDLVRVGSPFALTVDGDRAACSAAQVSLAHRPRLHTISRRGPRRGRGLTLILRATDQLEQYPQAKAAYLRAAAAWERALALTTITVVVDVDYGPTYFGQQFPSNVLGYTDAQLLFTATNYAFVRSHLVAEASGDDERALYERLPRARIRTDLGSTSGVYAPAAAFRAVHFLPSVAKPKADLDRGLGPPPAVAISSAYAFDFDASDGIAADARDFEAVAMHELGHVLGFTSTVGSRELNASFPVAVSFLDLFRVRPGTTFETFGSAERVQRSGGDQVFFAGTRELPLSTGRQDATGGDGRQASHWKDEALSGDFVGLMHPALRPGTHETLTDNDLLAFDRIGYTLAATGPPIVDELEASIAGDAIHLAGTIAEAGLAARSARIAVLDGNYRPISETAAIAVDFAGTTRFELDAPLLGIFGNGLVARLRLFDSDGAEIGSATAELGAADPGGAELRRAKFKDSVLTIKGRDLAEPLEVEVNGVAVGPDIPAALTNRGTRLELRAGAGRLGLRPGYNRVRVLTGALRSNIVVLELR